MRKFRSRFSDNMLGCIIIDVSCVIIVRIDFGGEGCHDREQKNSDEFCNMFHKALLLFSQKYTFGNVATKFLELNSLLHPLGLSADLQGYRMSEMLHGFLWPVRTVCYIPEPSGIR